MSHKFFDLTFTPSVKRAQEHYGTRRNYERFEGGKPDFEGLTDAEIDYISERDGFYMATVGESRQPYVQFRGGPVGFLRILDPLTHGYADFGGNLQYISTGNLSVNDRAALILMDYPSRRRLKLLARVKVVDAADDRELAAKLRMPNYSGKVERSMILTIEAFDWNCPRHITPRYTMEEIREMNLPLTEHIAKLEAEINDLRKKLIATN